MKILLLNFFFLTTVFTFGQNKDSISQLKKHSIYFVPTSIISEPFDLYNYWLSFGFHQVLMNIQLTG
ncbi:MAG: hypothetical protein HYU67_11970 [Flavobacteriia bacterium]|nr:hypothetical protein [Flavobacteriia bacterium]